MAARKGASLAGRKGPPLWLRNGPQPQHPEPCILVWLPYGNRAILRAATGALIIFEVRA